MSHLGLRQEDTTDWIAMTAVNNVIIYACLNEVSVFVPVTQDTPTNTKIRPIYRPTLTSLEVFMLNGNI